METIKRLRYQTVDFRLSARRDAAAARRLWRFAKLRQAKYLNNIVEIDQT